MANYMQIDDNEEEDEYDAEDDAVKIMHMIRKMTQNLMQKIMQMRFVEDTMANGKDLLLIKDTRFYASRDSPLGFKRVNGGSISARSELIRTRH